MEKGQGNEYRGKNLDEIDINVNELVSGEEDSEDEENEININEDTALKTIKLSKNKPNSSIKDKSLKQVSNQVELGSIKKKVIVIPWSEGDKGIVTSYFQKYILLGKTPKKNECEELMLLYPQINKPWKKIKDFVHNKINSQKKK